MAKKQSRASQKVVKDTRPPDEIAEERIAEWRDYRLKYQQGLIEAKEYTGAVILELDYLGLEKIPESIRTLQDLEFLDLSGNMIWELPEWIIELRELRSCFKTGRGLKKEVLKVDKFVARTNRQIPNEYYSKEPKKEEISK